jgi:hypothetical protein
VECCRRVSGVGLEDGVLARGTSSVGELLSSQLLPRAVVAVDSCGSSSKLVEEGGNGSGLPDPWCPVGGVRAPRSAEAVLQLLPVLVVLLQVWRLARAGALGLTAGEVRGAAPADVPLAFARSRRPRRVAIAATSTRSSPLKFLPGDSAVARGSFFSPSGEDEAPVVRQWIVFCAEDPEGLVAIFCFFRVLSVFRGQLSHVWTVPVISCFLT